MAEPDLTSKDPILVLAKTVLKGCGDLMESRSHYNQSHSIKDMMLHGPQDFLYEIHKKVMRADSILMAKGTDTTSGIPSIEAQDSLKDIINYAAYALAHIILEDNKDRVDLK